MQQTTKQVTNRYFPIKSSKQIYELLKNIITPIKRVAISLDKSLERNINNSKRPIKNRQTKSNPKRSEHISLSTIRPKRSLLHTEQNNQYKFLKINSRQYFLKKLKEKPKCLDTSTLDPPRIKRQFQTIIPFNDKTLSMMSPSQILRNFSAKLSSFERSQIKYYEKVYFLGQQTNKIRQGKNNWGFDNTEGSYLFKIGDHIAYRYQILEQMGQGSFGQVLKCKDHKTNIEVAIKMIKNKKQYISQAQIEINILKQLKQCVDSNSNRHIIEIIDSFMFRQHQCIVFELLSMNLYELLKVNGFQGLPLDLIRRFALQILTGITVLHINGIIHCDIKPENILLKHAQKSGIKIIDFGSSCRFNQKIYTYLQSRYYRAPQVILGRSYNQKIDIWSLGCVFAQLFLGYPLFPGKDQKSQMQTIISVLGNPPESLQIKYNKTQNSIKKIKLLFPDEQFCQFISKCLKWSPSQRSSIVDLIEDPWIINGLPKQVKTQHEQYIKQLQNRTQRKQSFRVRNV